MTRTDLDDATERARRSIELALAEQAVERHLIACRKCRHGSCAAGQALRQREFALLKQASAPILSPEPR